MTSRKDGAHFQMQNGTMTFREKTQYGHMPCSNNIRQQIEANFGNNKILLNKMSPFTVQYGKVSFKYDKGHVTQAN